MWYLFTGGAADYGDGAEGDAEGKEAVGDGAEHGLHLGVRHLAPAERVVRDVRRRRALVSQAEHVVLQADEVGVLVEQPLDEVLRTGLKGKLDVFVYLRICVF